MGETFAKFGGSLTLLQHEGMQINEIWGYFCVRASISSEIRRNFREIWALDNEISRKNWGASGAKLWYRPTCDPPVTPPPRGRLPLLYCLSRMHASRGEIRVEYREMAS